MDILVANCARCGAEHHVGFTEFRRPMVYGDNTQWTHWGICPNTNEPIMLRIEQRISARYGMLGPAELKEQLPQPPLPSDGIQKRSK